MALSDEYAVVDNEYNIVDNQLEDAPEGHTDQHLFMTERRVS